MKHIDVDKIVGTSMIDFGFITTTHLVSDAVQMLYAKKDITALFLEALNADSWKGINIVDRFHQFVVLAHLVLANELQGQIYFLDCRKINDPRLSDFSFLGIEGWRPEDEIKFRKICQTIRDDKNLSLAELRQTQT